MFFYHPIVASSHPIKDSYNIVNKEKRKALKRLKKLIFLNNAHSGPRWEGLGNFFVDNFGIIMISTQNGFRKWVTILHFIKTVLS